MDAATRTTVINSIPTRAVTLGLAYWISVVLAVELVFPDSKVALFWPANAFAATVLLYSDRKQWPLYLSIMALAYLVGRIPTSHFPLYTYFGLCVANMVEVFILATLVRVYFALTPTAENLPQVISTTILSTFPATIISTLIGSTFVNAALAETTFLNAAAGWLVSDLSSLILSLPVLLAWLTPTNPQPSQIKQKELFELIAILIAIGIASLYIFTRQENLHSFNNFLPYLLFPLFIWSAIRLSLKSTLTLIFTMGFSVIALTYLGYGPLNAQGLKAIDSVVLMNVGLITIVSAAIFLAVVLAERKQTEEKLLTQSAIITNMAEGAYLVRTSDATIVYANPKFEHMFGYKHGEMVGKHVAIVNAPTDKSPEETTTEISKILKTKGSWSGEIENKRKDGSHFWCYAKVSAYNHPHYGEVWISVHSDITQRKQAEQKTEEALKATELAKLEAERANHAKSEFLSRMSHELRTPLNAILGFSELLLLDKHLMNEEQREEIKHIAEAGGHLLYLINEVLDIAKIDAQRMNLSIEESPLEEVFSSALLLVKNLALEKGVTLHTPSTELPWVQADIKRLKQVMVNLLSNAIKYNHKGGTVTIAVTTTANDHVRISISDTGIGIKPEDQTLIFEPFYRVKLKGETIEGTGIGLSVVKRLVEVMHGQIGVNCEDNQGSTFWVELPQAYPTTTQLTSEEDNLLSATHLSTSQNERTILYIEDNPASLNLMQTIINKLSNCKLLSATNAEQGINIAQMQRPDLVLMDIDLPGMNGFEALKHLKSGYETSDIPVIAVSAHAMPEHIAKGAEAGFIDYITKPVQINQLLATLQRIL